MVLEKKIYSKKNIEGMIARETFGKKNKLTKINCGILHIDRNGCAVKAASRAKTLLIREAVTAVTHPVLTSQVVKLCGHKNPRDYYTSIEFASQ